MRHDHQVYYQEIAEGLWRGRFDFEIFDLLAFLRADGRAFDKGLALLLEGLRHLPGHAEMSGEIRCAPEEGTDGVAYVDVGVRRFGWELFHLEGRYALQPDGRSVAIEIDERFGPPGSPLRRNKRARAVIDQEGRRATYEMPLFGALPWTGVYQIGADRRQLSAAYRSAWGEARESMERCHSDLPQGGPARSRWEQLLALARALEVQQARQEHTQDPKAPFTCAYALVTRRLAYRLEELGADDPDWIVRLGTHFGQRYLDALADPHQAPRAWRRVFSALEEGQRGPLDHLLLAIGAHVIWDLPHALLSAGRVDDTGRSRIGDFHRLNQVLAEAIDPLQDRVAARYGPWLGYWDRLGRDWDERLSRSGLITARALAWYNAERLAEVGHQAQTQRVLERAVEDWVNNFPRRPWRPRSLQRWAQVRPPLARWWERRLLAPEGQATISRFQELVRDARRGLNSVAEPLRQVVAELSELGVPWENALIGPEQRESDWDPKTQTFHAVVPAFYRAPYDPLAALIEPDRWDELIDNVVEARYLEPPDATGRGRLREVVNILAPFLDHHPLHFSNELFIEIERHESPRRKVVRYRLAKSLDGSFEVDEGQLSIEELPGVGALVIVEKRIKIAHNPVLSVLLRLNPKALTWLLTAWMDEAARKGQRVTGEPRSEPVVFQSRSPAMGK
jgi:hypothetical protein